jgi:hypothetical protein
VTDERQELRAAGRATGLLWLVGGIFGALWYLVPGAELEHGQLGLMSCSLSALLGLACLFAPWTRMRRGWLYAGKDRWEAAVPVGM